LLPLSPPRLFANAIVMNVLGDGTGDHLAGIADLLSDPSIVLIAIARAKAAHAKLRWTPY
jgi:hypothetical protein